MCHSNEGCLHHVLQSNQRYVLVGGYTNRPFSHLWLPRARVHVIWCSACPGGRRVLMLQFLAPINQTSTPHTPHDTSTDHWWGSFTLIAFACLVLALPALWYVPTYAYSYTHSSESVPQGIPVESSPEEAPKDPLTGKTSAVRTECRPLLVLPLATDSH